MAELFDTIRRLLREEKYAVSGHAAERLDERGFEEWQVVVGTDDGKLMLERPKASPNPAVEVRVILPDGTECKAVWSYLPSDESAKLVTVHYFDEQRS